MADHDVGVGRGEVVGGGSDLKGMIGSKLLNLEN